MAQSSTPHKKLNLLQVYRGIAAVLVVMFHLNDMSAERLNQVTFFNLFQAGWSGVDYFLCIERFYYGQDLRTTTRYSVPG